MKKNWWCTLVVSLVSFVFTWSTAHANGIADIVYEGAGCPQGSVAQLITTDGQRLTLIFDQFFATAGPNISESAATKYCRIDLTLQSNERVAVSLDTRGSVRLPAGMAGNQHQNVLRAKRANLVTHFVGPTTQAYLVHSTATVLAQGNPARTTVTIILQLAVDRGNNTTDVGQLANDSFELTLNGG